MGREVRRVPPDWEHPRDSKGNYMPMYDETFEEAAAQWKADFSKWESDPDSRGDHDCEFWEYDGNPPDREYYRPKWPEESATHYQMYEDTSEGTPISPVIATPEELARWLVDNKASAFADQTATYEEWLRVCNGGWAPSAALTENGIISGVSAFTKE